MALLNTADQQAFQQAILASPVWTGIATAASAFKLDSNVLLHAGPAFDDVEQISTPIMNSAAVAAVFEGLVGDFDAAITAIHAGDLVLRPAQDYSVVTPLAAVVSASMPLHVISSGAGKNPAYAPINGGARPSLRLGLRSTAVLEHIRWLNSTFADFLLAALENYRQSTGDAGIELIPIAAEGLAKGDDCHGRTIAANGQMMATLLTPGTSAVPPSDILAFIDASPSLFLNVWMAATKHIMKSAEGVANASFLTSIAGNGVTVGIQVSGLPGRWFTSPATPPQGRFDIDAPNNRSSGAIGDSAIIEGFGTGAMAIQHSPEQLKQFQEFLPDDLDDRLMHLPCGDHPGFASIGLKVGLCARTVLEQGFGPVIALGIIDRQGEKGRLGGGIYMPPNDPFQQAVNTLDSTPQ